MTIKELNELEEYANSLALGMQRRLALLACARSDDELSYLSIKYPEAFQEMWELIAAFKDSAQGLAEIAETAYTRMLIAGRPQEADIH
jgi:hypothetical protein